MTMETSQYLERIERYLRPLPVAERVDIVAEIKSEMLELEAAGMPPQEIAARLGTPEELARGYLGEAIVKSPRFSLRKLGAVAAFYSLAGAHGCLFCRLPAFAGSALCCAARWRLWREL